MIRFATIGTNFIVDDVLLYAKAMPDLEYVSAYSRTSEISRAFAAKHNAKRFDTDLLAIATAEDIDGVYIASPNALHYEQALLMLQHKKHVLCEKTITTNAKELAHLFAIAEENNVVIMEAVRCVYDPAFDFIAEQLPKLGKIRKANFQYCTYSSRYDDFQKGIIQNAFNPDLSNGALMDIGVYCIHPMVQLFGKPKKILANSIFLENGVEGAGTALFSYDHMQGAIEYSKISTTHTPSQIQGEAATMTIMEIADAREIKIIYRDGRVEEYTIDKPKHNLKYAVEEWISMISENKKPTARNAVSMLTLEAMDEIRRQCGIVFPADQK